MQRVLLGHAHGAVRLVAGLRGPGGCLVGDGLGRGDLEGRVCAGGPPGSDLSIHADQRCVLRGPDQVLLHSLSVTACVAAVLGTVLRQRERFQVKAAEAAIRTM